MPGAAITRYVLRSLNHELVRTGTAWWYQQNARRHTVLPVLEQEARTAERGLWADARPVPPREMGGAAFRTPTKNTLT